MSLVVTTPRSTALGLVRSFLLDMLTAVVGVEYSEVHVDLEVREQQKVRGTLTVLSGAIWEDPEQLEREIQADRRRMHA